MSLPLIGYPIHDLLMPERRGYMRSDCGTYVTATTPDGQTIRILRHRVRRGLQPARRPATYTKAGQGTEFARLAAENGLSYAQVVATMLSPLKAKKTRS